MTYLSDTSSNFHHSPMEDMLGSEKEGLAGKERKEREKKDTYHGQIYH